MITCRHLTEFLMDYLAGTLPPGEAAVFEQHLSLCEACRRYLRSYEQTVRLGRRSFDPVDEPAPAEIPEDLVLAILRTRSQRD